MRLHAYTQQSFEHCCSAAMYSEKEEEGYRHYRSVKTLIVMSATICCVLILQGKLC
jgi:hypothetical protein